MLKKLINYYKNIQAPVKASLWFLICGFLQKGISMLTTPLFTRIMTEAEYGRFSVYNTWVGLIQIVASLNLAAGVYIRGLVKNEKDQDRFSSAMLGLSTTCILVWCGIYALFHETVNRWLGMSTLLMIAMFIQIWTHSTYHFWTNRERGAYRYKKLVALTLVYVILRPLLGMICVLCADKTNQAEARILTTVLVDVVLFSMLFISMMRKGRKFYHKEYWHYALKFNIPLVPHYLSQIVLNQSDRLMINSLCGPAEAAYYSVAYSIAMVLEILNNSVAATMNPWIYRALQDKEYKKIGKLSCYVIGLIAVLNLAVVLCAPEMMKVLAPNSYQAALWVIPPVTVSVFFSFLYTLFVAVEYHFEKTHYVTIATIIGAVLNIVLNALLIPVFGFVAAGYTTLACFILYAFAHYYFMRKVIKQYLSGVEIYNVRIIFLIGAALLIGSGVIMLLYKTVAIRYGLLLLILIALLWKRKMLAGLVQTLKKSNCA